MPHLLQCRLSVKVDHHQGRRSHLLDPAAPHRPPMSMKTAREQLVAPPGPNSRPELVTVAPVEGHCVHTARKTSSLHFSYPPSSSSPSFSSTSPSSSSPSSCLLPPTSSHPSRPPPSSSPFPSSSPASSSFPSAETCSLNMVKPEICPSMLTAALFLQSIQTVLSTHNSLHSSHIFILSVVTTNHR